MHQLGVMLYGNDWLDSYTADNVFNIFLICMKIADVIL